MMPESIFTQMVTIPHWHLILMLAITTFSLLFSVSYYRKCNRVLVRKERELTELRTKYAKMVREAYIESSALVSK